MLAHMKTRHIDNGTEVYLKLPHQKNQKLTDAIRIVVELAGIKICDDRDEDTLRSEEIFPDGCPAMAFRGLRGKEDLTQQQMAEKLGISQNRISDMESGRRPISIAMAKRLSELFGVSHKAFL